MWRSVASKPCVIVQALGSCVDGVAAPASAGAPRGVAMAIPAFMPTDQAP
jgi:hypothetical protein